MKIRIFSGALLLLMFNAVLVYADGGAGLPCGGTDPDAMCPLDTWVIYLAFAAVIFAGIYLYKKGSRLPGTQH